LSEIYLTPYVVKAALLVSLAANVGLGAYLVLRPRETAPQTGVREVLEASPEGRALLEEVRVARETRGTTSPGLAASTATEAAGASPALAVAAETSEVRARAPAAGSGSLSREATPVAVGGTSARTGPPAPPPPPVASPESETNPTRAAERARARQVVDAAKAKVLQIQDAGLREEGLEDLAALLRPGSDWASVQAGLQGLIELRAVDYDRDRFRALILPWTRDGDLETRARALYALAHVKREPEDVRLAIDLAGAAKGEFRGSVAGLLVHLADRKVEGEVARAFERLLEPEPGSAEDRRHRIAVANALRNAWADPPIQERVAEMWRNRGREDHVLDYVVAQVKGKEGALVAACLDLMASEHVNRQVVEGRLGARSQDVAESARAALAAGAASRLATAADPWLQTRLLEILAAHGTAVQADAVRALSENALVVATVRQKATETWKTISARSVLEPGR
jgi:hypothetical protein